MSNSITTKKRCWLIRILKDQWHPQPVDEPAVDPELPQLDQVQRSAEVFRYSVLKTEFWLSPKGTIREYLRFNLGIGILLGMPALLIVPIITFVLGQFNTWTAYLVQIAKNFIIFPITALIAVAIITGIIFVLRILLGR